MEQIDPTTNLPLPPDAIQRVLFIGPKVHVYNIPPLTSNKGYNASSWTADNNKRLIFTARLRVLETAVPIPGGKEDGKEKLKTDILLEDPSNGQLFAAAPYTAASVVEQVLDSSRFFAVRVQGEGGRKAVLGIGFEERSEAFDFSVALQEVRRTLGIEQQNDKSGRNNSKKQLEEQKEEKRDFSLKEGEMIVVDLGGKGASRRKPVESQDSASSMGFSLPPPPTASGGRGASFLPPPPSAREARAGGVQKTSSQTPDDEDSGFDDGEFGEFQ